MDAATLYQHKYSIPLDCAESKNASTSMCLGHKKKYEIESIPFCCATPSGACYWMGRRCGHILGLLRCAARPVPGALSTCGAGGDASTSAVPVTFSARLYPANDLAARYGMVNAIVTSDLNGRCSFNSTISGESFVGDSTRKVSASREGIANGAGNRGNYINCEYLMNSATLGTGNCTLSNSARFSMHVGQ